MSLFERLGGEEAISAVVDKFYQFMISDQRVAHYFATIDMQKQRKRQKQFITLVTEGPHNYEGQDMKIAHCKHAIGQFEFDSTWQNLSKSLEFFKVPEAQTQQLKEIFYSVQDDIVNTKKQVVEEAKPSKCPFNHQKMKEQLQVSQKKQQQEKSLFDKLGGKQALSLVVQKFYDLMLADSRVSKYFQNTNMEKQKNSQIEFLSMVTGGPMTYAGKDMKQAHCPYKIGVYQFDSTWENLQKSLQTFNVTLQLIKEIQAIFYSVQQDIVNYQPKKEQQNINISIPVTLQQSHIVNHSPIKSINCKQSRIQQNVVKYSDKPSQNQKRKIKLEVMEKQQSSKNKGKLNNCPYSKPYY